MKVCHNVKLALYTVTAFTASKKQQEIARHLETKLKLSEDSILKREGNQVTIGNNEVDE